MEASGTQCVCQGRKLSDRKLSGNIEEYYFNIWNDAVGTLKQYDFVDYKLAGVFAF